MLLNSSTGLVILVLVLIAGWLLGLASSSGGKKWKARYVAERDAHAAARKDADARIAAADRRVTELERAPVAAPVAAAPVAPIAPRVTSTTPVARPAYPADERRGWFEFGDRRVR